MGDLKADLEAANEAVRAASVSCRAVQERLVKPETLEKKDKSPVTVADFASQAIVCSMLAERLPGDAVVGEESAAELREDAQAPLRDVVVERVRSELATDASADQVLGWIDLGAADASGDRYWTLDPIDGTKGFLRGEQYAVALGLIEKGRVVLGVLGCPNLPLDDGKGALFFATEGGPAYVQPLFEDGEAREISVGALTRACEARFCESVESGHSNQDESAKIVSLAVARNDASIYLRMPTRKDYQEKIWDHAAGSVIVEAAGGRVTDVDGRDLDFTRGRTLEANSGVVATSGAIHDEVIDAVRRARG
jgi:3'(2'), 5'-bisphosphate nucleotidase